MADRTLGGLFSADAPAAEGGSNGASAGFDGGLQVDPIAEGSCLRHAHTAALTVPVGRWSDCTYFVPPPITAATNNAAVVTVNTTRATPFMVERPCLLAAVYLYVSALSGASAVFRAALHRYQPDSPASTVVVSDRGNQAIAGGGVQGWSFGGAGRIPLQPDVMYLWAFAPHLNGSASVNVQTYGAEREQRYAAGASAGAEHPADERRLHFQLAG